jgi:probable F420-dependent oxidoreductase
MTRPMRFGLLSDAGDATAWRRDVALAEDDGYSTIVLTDHLDLSGAHVTQLSWLPSLADALARTIRLHASVMVANQDLRHPAVLAREVTTLDRLSDGRIELGLGAGHVEQEYAWAGLSFDPPGARVSRLAEHAAVVRGLTTAGPDNFSFTGEHYTITDMPVAPLPTAGRLPIMIGGGRPRVLSIAAKVADIVNLNNIRDDGPADSVLSEKVAWVEAAAGERMADVELAMSVPVVAGGLGSPAAELERAVAQDPFAGRLASRMGLEALAASALTLAGTTDAIVERLEAWRERHGISYVVVPAGAADVMAPVLERLV